ncbi:MAG: phospho-N-acetylmuramoyl-pentapeptide-transferase [Phycisphaeraceae bacterium]|nr:phospho-N-acetylmuramoyl-pentapeptide-transferase [Phycisphaeraceae bacterium]
MIPRVVELLQETLQSWGLSAVVRLMMQLEFRAFAAVIFSFAAVMLAGPRVIERLRRLKIGDNPEFHRSDLNELMKQKKGTPTMGGLLICGSVLLTTLLFADVVHNRYIHVTLAVLIWLAVVGGFDDWLKLTAARRAEGARDGLLAWEKLLFQLGIGLIASWFIYHASMLPDGHVLNLPFQRTHPPTAAEQFLQALPLEPGVLVLSLPLFLLIGTLFIAYTSNAVNITDGMDGLAGGVILVASFAMMLLCLIAGSQSHAYTLNLPYVPGTAELMVMAGAMAGATLGFLWFNCAPASVFMGDTGSLAMGGVLATMAVAIRQEILLILIAGICFAEAMSVMLQVTWFKSTRRMFGEGRRLFRCSPIHHHFQLVGWTETQVVTRFWLVSVMLTMIALASLKVR